MSDEAPEITPDTPTPTADTQAEIDWQKRYEDLQPEYTRKSQLLSDEDALIAHIAEKFPHRLAANEPEPEPEVDPYEVETGNEDIAALKAELEAQRAWQQEVQAERSRAQFDRDLQTEFGDESLSAKAHDWILGRTLSLQGNFGGDGRKALKAAAEEWREIVSELAPPEPEPKRNAPHVVKGGTAATGTPDWSQMTESEINQYMAERARALAQ